VREPGSTKLCHVANLVLGAFLFASPWLFTFAPGIESWNAHAVGALIFAVSIASRIAFAIWQEWLNLVVGLWAAASPWVLGFAGMSAMTIHLIVGILVAVLATIDLWTLHRSAAPRRASR
jgi:hypothetical protein